VCSLKRSGSGWAKPVDDRTALADITGQIAPTTYLAVAARRSLRSTGSTLTNGRPKRSPVRSASHTGLPRVTSNEARAAGHLPKTDPGKKNKKKV
jgi:hypothetical protein